MQQNQMRVFKSNSVAFYSLFADVAATSKEMASKRKKKKKSKSKQKYIPIVVLNNQIPIDQDNDNLDFRRRKPSRPLRPKRPVRPRSKSYFYYRQRNSPPANFLYFQDPRPSGPVPTWHQRPPEVQRRMGFFDTDSSKSEDNYISASKGGCCGGGGGGGGDISGTEALIFLAALAFAVAFLNQQITMFLGPGRRKRGALEEGNNFENKSVLTVLKQFSRGTILLQFSAPISIAIFAFIFSRMSRAKKQQ